MPESLRFALLHHTGHSEKPDHYDLLLETRSVGDENERTVLAFATLANSIPTGEGAGDLLISLPMHRKLYLNYEGPVEGNRGSVVRVDDGVIIFLTECKTPISMTLFGRKINGAFSIKSFDGKHLRFVKEAGITSVASATPIE